jgi:hypothetical protein
VSDSDNSSTGLVRSPGSVRDKVHSAPHDLQDVAIRWVISEMNESLAPVDVGGKFSLDHSFKPAAFEWVIAGVDLCAESCHIRIGSRATVIVM